MKGKSVLVILALVLFLGVGMLAWSVPASAAPVNAQLYVSTGGNDANDCSSPALACKTINRAYSVANTGTSTISTTINIAAGTYNEQVTLDKYIVLQGPTSGTATIDGAGLPAGALITVGLAKRASLNNLTLRNASNAGNGGGVLITQNSAVSVRNTIITNNTAAGGAGIYVQNGGTLFVTRTSIDNNIGGGVYNDVNTTASIDTSAVVSNTANAGIVAKGTLALVNTTVGGNAAGGISVTGSPTATVGLYNVTVWDNTGTAVSVGSGNLRLQNSIVTQCSTSGGTITSGGYNQIGSGTCGTATTGDATGNPMLDPLALNKGFTLNYYPQAGSPVVDKIPLANCVDNHGAPLTGDQRGSARPQGPACDIGAVERGDAPTITSITPSSAPVGTSVNLTITGNGFTQTKCQVFWNSTVVASGAGVCTSSTTAVVTVPSSLLTIAGPVNITVENTPFNSGNVSGPVVFTVEPPAGGIYTIYLPEIYR